jgi:putative transposase
MSLFHDKYRVESIRLQGYDYSQNGMYFVTVCTNDRECLFGRIDNKKMVLNRYGAIIEQCWNDLPNHYPNFIQDEFVVMPDHIHAIIIINNDMETASVAGTEITVVETGFKPVSTDTTNTTDTNTTDITDTMDCQSAHSINKSPKPPWFVRIRPRVENVFGTSN